MSGSRVQRILPRVGVLAVALVMFALGAGLVLHANLVSAKAPAKAAAPKSAAPSASATATATASASSKPRPTAAASPSASALDQAARGRSAALADLAKKAQLLSHQRKTARPVATFTFAQFNIQGSTHRGNIGGRMATAVRLIHRYGATVASLQEFASNQQGIFLRMTGWGCYPCGSGPKRLDGENSVVWDKSRFDAVKLETRAYPYFGGSIRNMPRVLLRDKKSGATFLVTSYHNPANVHGPAGKWRSIAVSRQAADANAARAAKIPLIVSGDMNDRASYYCAMGPRTGMHSADGSNASGGCRLAGNLWIDWVLGSSDVAFSGYLRNNSGEVRSSSDHPIVITQVKVTGRPGEGVDNRTGG